MNRSAPALFFCFDKSGDFYRRISFCQEYGSCSWSLEEFPAKQCGKEQETAFLVCNAGKKLPWVRRPWVWCEVLVGGCGCWRG